MPLQAYYPLNEQSGTTAYDKSGNSHDGTVNGATPGEVGILGETGYGFNGQDGHVSSPGWFSINKYNQGTVTLWFKGSEISNGSRQYMFASRAGGDGRLYILTEDGELKFGYGSGWPIETGVPLSDDQWYFCSIHWDGQSVWAYLDTEQVMSDSLSKSGDNTGDLNIGSNPGGASYHFGGVMSEVRIYDHALTKKEVDCLHQTATSTSQLMTGLKSLSSQETPDLQELSYSLNGGSIELHTFGSPGTVDQEVISVELGGSTSYGMEWSNSHKEFMVLIEKVSSGVTTTPTLSSMSLGGMTVPVAPSDLTEVSP